MIFVKVKQKVCETVPYTIYLQYIYKQHGLYTQWHIDASEKILLTFNSKIIFITILTMKLKVPKLISLESVLN